MPTMLLTKELQSMRNPNCKWRQRFMKAIHAYILEIAKLIDHQKKPTVTADGEELNHI